MPDRLNPHTQRPHGPNTWCSLCERVQQTAHWVSKNWRCPTPHCPATAVHARAWAEVRLLNTRYPEEPVLGQRYTFSDPGGGV